MNQFLVAALEYAKKGWAVFPLIPNTKRPIQDGGFHLATTDPGIITGWWSRWPTANLGAATGLKSNLIVVDVDVKKNAKGLESVKVLQGLIPTALAKTPTGGFHYFYILHKPMVGATGILNGLDIKADRGYIVLPPSIIDGKKYEWLNLDVPVQPITEELFKQILELKEKNKKDETHVDDDGKIPYHHRNTYLAKMAGRFRYAGLGMDEILPILLKINSQKLSEPLPEKEVETTCKSICTYAPGNPKDFTESGIAEEFTKRHGDNLRYVSEWGQWFRWNDLFWEKENTLACYDMARNICSETAVFVKKESERKRILSGSTVAAVERMAKADRTHAAVPEQWDKNIWLLNTPSGIIDLNNGTTIPTEKNHYITKITKGSLSDCSGVKWAAFLDTATNKNEAVKSYLKRIAGYALTGATFEQALFFFYGPGGNGKSVFLEVISATMGSYAKNSTASTFMASEHDRHPSDIAVLKGARLVTATEIEKNQRWSESRIKSLTGGDVISARLMRQDFFEFKPQFKLFISGNNKPQISDVDEAMKRRLFLIPFLETIPESARIKDLANIIVEEESDAVLAWMIEGCLEWQEHGLMPPKEVTEATKDYLETEDSLGRWMDEDCILAANATSTSSALFSSWKTWAEKNREFIGSQKQFSQLLKKRAFKTMHSMDGAKFIGIGLKGSEVQSEFENTH